MSGGNPELSSVGPRNDNNIQEDILDHFLDSGLPPLNTERCRELCIENIKSG